jgi:hypothetical protein
MTRWLIRYSPLLRGACNHPGSHETRNRSAVALSWHCASPRCGYCRNIPRPFDRPMIYPPFTATPLQSRSHQSVPDEVLSYGKKLVTA